MPNAIKSDVEIELDKKANLLGILIALSQKHPLLTSTSDLTSNKLFAKSVEPPVGTTTLQLRTNSVTIGIAAYASIT